MRGRTARGRGARGVDWAAARGGAVSWIEDGRGSQAARGAVCVSWTTVAFRAKVIRVAVRSYCAANTAAIVVVTGVLFASSNIG
jgi:hypothetical protein